MTKKIFVPVIALSLFMFSTAAFAITETSIVNTAAISNYGEEELVALIAKLQKQLELVRQNQVACTLAEADLSLGDGEDSTSKEYTKNLQAFLKEKGYFTLAPTGYFGKITRTSLMNFQRENGLEQTGELNALTRTYIKSLKCRKAFSVGKPIEKIEIKPVQKEVMKPTQSGSVTSITLAGNGNMVKWSTAGYSKEGFKIVWSKNPTPTYPNRDGDKYVFLTDPNAYNTTLEAFGGTGTYHVRVCEYLGGSCGVYSNEIKLSL